MVILEEARFATPAHRADKRGNQKHHRPAFTGGAAFDFGKEIRIREVCEMHRTVFHASVVASQFLHDDVPARVAIVQLRRHFG